MRKIRKTALIILVAFLGYWLLQKGNVSKSWKGLFTAKEVVIDETPILISEIKSIGQLITYAAYDEVVADTIITTRGSAFVNSFNTLAPVPVLPSADKQLVLIGRGRVLAGIDLTHLTDSSLVINHDTITLFLPKPEIIEAIVNPSDFEIFIEKGPLSSQEVTLVKLQARRKLQARALQQNILGKADAKSRSILTDFLRNLGSKEVRIY